MSNKMTRVTTILMFGAVAACLTGAVIAGDLNPPAGPVAPTMKTLDEVEPRIPLSPADVPIVINQRGSYYLTGNIQASVSGVDAITINADDVTLDLMGHAITNSEIAFFNSGVAIASTAENVRVLNGSISGCAGAGLSGPSSRGCAAIDIRASSCGGEGIRLGNEAIVRGCTATANTLTGIFCGADSLVENSVAVGNAIGIRASSGGTVRGCVASDNTSTGISLTNDGVVAECTATGNGGVGVIVGLAGSVTRCSTRDNAGNGISVGAGSLVECCTAYSNDQSGITATTVCRVIECNASANGAHGVSVASDCLVSNNLCQGNGGAVIGGSGVLVTGIDNRVDGNTCTDNDAGISVTGSGNLIVRNSASGNGTPYGIAAGNSTGTIQNSPVGAGAWDNFEF